MSLLSQIYQTCAQRISKLQESLITHQDLFPLQAARLRSMSSHDEEAVDALILRYSQSIAMIQDHLFRAIAIVEQEDLAVQSNRDRTLLMEKLGAIRSAENFGSAAILRNKFAHHYPEDVTVQIERINLVAVEAKQLIDTFSEITQYLQSKNLILI